MLKLMRFPRGTNRNRTLKSHARPEVEEDSDAEVERIFRRFWHERTMPTANCDEQVSIVEGGNSACE